MLYYTGKISVSNAMTYVFYTMLYIFIGEGNGTPLQYSCLENPMDRGAYCIYIYICVCVCVCMSVLTNYTEKPLLVIIQS